MMPERGRLAGHVMLDSLSVIDGADVAEGAGSPAIELAFQRIVDVGAVSATLDTDNGVLTLDVTNLLGGTLATMQWLVGNLAACLGASETDVIVQAREYLDAQQGSPAY